MKNFKVGCVQIASGPNVEANLNEIAKYINDAKNKGADLIILPENFAMMAEKDLFYLDIQESLGEGRIQDFISKQAKKNEVWIVAGTIPIKSEKKEKLFSTCIIYNDKGEMISAYSKMHLFDVNLPNTNEEYRESDIYLNGTEVVTVETPFCKIGLSICYDLRFPELFRKLSESKAELICLPAAFTSFTGKAHWEHLIKARAIENLVYFAASAQGGYHVSGRETYGNSIIVSPWGETLGILKNKSGVVVTDINLESLKKLRSNFPCLDHRII
tara:strand:- start:119 stop:934 length:816 start_codon:yes stop_codon:yes gene_type:complete